MFDVRIKFQGLCGFVPGSDLDQNPRPPWVGVFLVGADEGARDDFGVALPPHYPFVKFRLSDLKGLEGAPDDTCYWQLRDEDVVMLTGNNAGGFVEVNMAKPRTLGPVPVPRGDTTQERFFDWVPRIDDVKPGSGVIDPECFRNLPGRRVKARVHLTEGRLVTNALGEFQGNYVLSQFDPPPDGGAPLPARVNARLIALELDNVRGPFALRSRRFKPGAEAGEVRSLVFRDPGEGNTLELSIVNLCPSDLVEDTTKRPRNPIPDDDYAWFFVLSETEGTAPLVVAKLPSPVPVKFEFGGAGGGEPAQCTGTVYKPPGSTVVSFMINQAAEIKNAI